MKLTDQVDDHSLGGEPQAWQDQLFEILKASGIKQLPYVPDGGHARLIERAHAEPGMRAISLTTEEEGIALAAGAWLGGDRSVLLMQSSGAGNCINMLSLLKSGRFPFLTVVTMRGEWGEFNPWQVPMGSKVQHVLETMDVQVLRVERAADVAETVQAGIRMAFEGGTPVAILLSQRLIGAKVFVK